MVKKILFNATPMEKRAALLEDGKVVELVVERPHMNRLVGNIYRGRVETVLPGLQAAFIDIGLEKCGFLHGSDVDPSLLLEKDSQLVEQYESRNRSKKKKIIHIPIEKVVARGQEILVQVTKDPISTKGPKLTTQISLAGRFLVLIPDTDFIGVSKKMSDARKRRKLKQILAQLKPQGIGFIVRTIGTDVDEDAFISEIHTLIDDWRKLQSSALEGKGPKRVFRERGISTRVIRDLLSNDVAEVQVDQRDDFEEILAYLKKTSPNLCGRVHFYQKRTALFDAYTIEKDLERSLRRKVWLRSGGYIIIDRTEALVAIDVNTGRNIGRKKVDENILQTNLEAAEEICRQLRLRDIGGLIVVDFIDMRPLEHRRRLESEMRRILRKGGTAAACTGLSRFGLMEITRKRERPELQELYTDVCHVCNGIGWVFSPATITARIDRWLHRSDTSGKEQGSGVHAFQLTVHPSIAAYLLKDNGKVIERIQQEYRVKLRVVEDEDRDQDEFEFEPLKA